MKTALRIYAQNDTRKSETEAHELAALAKLVNLVKHGQENDRPEEQEKKDLFSKAADPEDKPIFKPNLGKDAKAAQQVSFERIVEKLLEYNEKINNGREISVLEYVSKLDPLSPFMK